jgi:hypothetical protein
VAKEVNYTNNHQCLENWMTSFKLVQTFSDIKLKVFKLSLVSLLNMKFITTFALFASSIVAVQVNWYHDTKCDNYKDTTFPTQGIQGNSINGEPASAGSALFVTDDVSLFPFIYNLNRSKNKTLGMSK